MKIKAITGFTAFDEGRMKVFNPGDSGEVTDDLAREYVDAGKAKPVTGAKAADAPKKAAAGPNPLTEARKRYKAAFGKGPSPKWDIAEIQSRIDRKVMKDAAAPVRGEDGEPLNPPAGDVKDNPSVIDTSHDAPPAA